MKTMKKLIPALAMLLVSAVLLGTSTFAWFSMNRTVTATGMKVKATSSSSLVIAQYANSLGASTVTPVGTNTNADFDAALTTLIPATHDDSATYTTQLKYVTNQSAVSANGFQAGEVALTYANAANVTGDNPKTYYIDYVVCIAAAGGALTNQDLTAEWNDGIVAGFTTDTAKAVSIDFYVKTCAQASDYTSGIGTYMGTINGANKKISNSANNANNTSGTKVTLVTNSNIPANTTDSFLVVTMRVYFDGALPTDDAQIAYVRSNSIDTTTTGYTLGVKFVAADHT